MPATQRKRLVGRLLVVLTIGVAVTSILFHNQAQESSRPYRITLIAMGMAFTLRDRPNVRNPELVLPSNRLVEIEIRNEDTGADHNLTIDALDVKTPILSPGELAVLRFVVPESKILAYYCILHPVTMRGQIRAE